LTISKTKRLFQRFEICEFNISEPFGPVVDFVFHDPDTDDFAILKIILDLTLGEVKSEISDMGGVRWLRRQRKLSTGYPAVAFLIYIR
jgi:hypothetical protein